MRRFVVFLLSLQLLLGPAAGFAHASEVSPQPEKSMNVQAVDGNGPKKSIKTESNDLDPSSYPLIEKSALVDNLLDSYGSYQSIYYMDATLSPYSSDDMRIKLLYSAQAFNKDSILTMEFYTENSGTLSYVSYAQFNTAGYSQVYLNSDLLKSNFIQQPYIYIRLGVAPSYSSTYYSDVTTFKVANPFYSSGSTTTTDDRYAVISNESTDGWSSEPTGTFSVNDMQVSADKELKSSAYQIDVNKPFHPSITKASLFQKNTSSIKPEYISGESKSFWVNNLSTNSYYQLNARLAYSGSKANVWVNNSFITDQDALKLGQEFDQNIYPSVTNNFGVESDVDHDGKINILVYDIQDGFSGSGAYVGGYFYAGDLYTITYSNQSEIFYIDTYPSMGSGSTKDVTKAYSTLAHEFQHMVNYNQNVLVEHQSTMDTWINEGLSMAAEQIYTGQGLQSRVDYYNASSWIQNGHSLLYWDNNGDVLSNYSLSYLFVEYFKIQAGQGDSIFKEILRDPNNSYQAIENAAKKYISPDMTFGKLMTDFRIALLLKQPTGLYGFGGDPFFDSLQEKIYSGSSANLKGGGAIVTTFNSQDGFVEPLTKGQDVTFTILNKGDQGSGGGADTTPPASPVVSPVGDTDSQLTGTAEPNATVYAMRGDSEIGRTTSDGVGDFTMLIARQSAGTLIEVYAMDAAGNVSEATTMVVKDATTPAKPVVNEVMDKDTSVSGQAEVGTKVEVKVNGSVIGSGTAGSDGKFAVTIPVQKAGTTLTVTAMDQAGNVSEATTVVVKDATAPGKPVVNEVTDQNTSVNGQAEAGSRIEVKVNGSVVGSGTAGSDGKFAVTIPVQKAGTTLTVTAMDQAGNVSEATTVVVKDATAPGKPVVNEVTDQNTSVNGQAEAGSRIEVKVNGSVVGSGTAGSDGKFAVTIPVQKAGTTLTVTAMDQDGNVSGATTVVVKDATAPAMPVVNEVTDQDTSVSGQAEVGTKVEVKVNGTVIGSGTAGSDGKFAITIPVQKAGTTLTITATDQAGNVSEATIITVKRVALHGWIKEDGHWFYYDLQTGSMETGWLNDRGTWYYLGQDGVMRTGWLKDGGNWYYLTGSGAMETGWLYSGGAWYYLTGSGAMKTGWLYTGGVWYYLTDSGAMKTGWLYTGGSWYYLTGSGAMETGWLKDGSTWYYLNGSGSMVTGWVNIGSRKYYFTSGGAWVK